MNQFKHNEVELIIHNIINDTRMKNSFDMSIEEIVHDISRLNYVRQLLTSYNINFLTEVTHYRDRLLKHIEEI